MGRARHPATLDRPEDWARGSMRDVSLLRSGRTTSPCSPPSVRRPSTTTSISAPRWRRTRGPEATCWPRRRAELAQLCEHLHSIGLRPTVLSRREIAAVHAPVGRSDRAERLALWGDGSIPTSGAGTGGPPPRLRHAADRRLCPPGGPNRGLAPHRRGHRVDVPAALDRVMPGSVRTVSMHLEAVSTAQALAEVRDARTTGGMAQRKRDEKGIITTEEEERRVDEARSRERELTRGFRQHKIAGLVMVSSPDAETAARAWRQAERKAVECHLDLRELHARGHEAWAATLAAVPAALRSGAALMLRLAPMSVTTRHSASAYPFQCQAGLPLVGPVIGQEVLGQGMFCYDPFCLYDTETLLSPCMLVSGNKGYGKSAFVKAYLHRQSMAGKWLAILDPKGEYLDLAARDGLSVLGLAPGRPGPAQSPRRRSGPRQRRGTDDVRGRRIGGGGGPGRVGRSGVRCRATSARW